ncbi:MAG: hypothetical protein ABSA14_12265, partial [Acidimicrobiales bacterium]
HHVFASSDGALSELNALTGALVRVISDTAFDNPEAMTIGAGKLFVSNCAGDSVAEVDTASDAASTMSGWSYPFASPIALVLAEGRLFVANASSGSLTEVEFKSKRH